MIDASLILGLFPRQVKLQSILKLHEPSHKLKELIVHPLIRFIMTLNRKNYLIVFKTGLQLKSLCKNRLFWKKRTRYCTKIFYKLLWHRNLKILFSLLRLEHPFIKVIKKWKSNSQLSKTSSLEKQFVNLYNVM